MSMENKEYKLIGRIYFKTLLFACTDHNDLVNSKTFLNCEYDFIF